MEKKKHGQKDEETNEFENDANVVVCALCRIQQCLNDSLLALCVVFSSVKQSCFELISTIHTYEMSHSMSNVNEKKKHGQKDDETDEFDENDAVVVCALFCRSIR